ncbi:hypothetical protein NBRC10512_004109 [Rhodotorula toruloides]|uniref:Oxoglutarate iron-dependent oxygenase n=1 Tax=Rhodotorula toruloides (strain NP11) TaxID=1130832 RepID=M7WYH2_RHOT1|nr:oxoglutarate iron-dependent oxygenase [Rhodotorula toruloides NP11]EMS25672.1 oxoglutarate iron-dependent oxygenase [Rhodotorula toruloides NP11]KAJ8296112.1 hypothetical protein OF846_001425 [Rhodotorula toruloides]
MACPLPIVDLDAFRASSDSLEARNEAVRARPPPPQSSPTSRVDPRLSLTQAAEALIEYGALIAKDSRVSEQENERFLDLLEEYFAQDEQDLRKDLRPEVHFQVGVTLENTEKPKCHSYDPCKAIIASLDPEERPLDLEGGKADPKCRFFYRMGETPPRTDFPSLRMENVIPSAFASTWQESMDRWGTQIKQSVEGVSEMLAVGLGLPQETLLEAGRYGSHLLAPTATDLRKYGRVGEIFAGFHTDLNFLTIHGRSRFPGLHIWARNTGKRISVKLPPGHLLVQAGKQLEHFTGGLILAGYHEVVCTPATLAALAARPSDSPAIRISSTFFWHLSSDYTLSPRSFVEHTVGSELVQREKRRIEERGETWDVGQYEEGLKVGTLVQNELKEIALHSGA